MRMTLIHAPCLYLRGPISVLLFGAAHEGAGQLPTDVTLLQVRLGHFRS